MITNKKPTVVWFTAITCNGNTHSLLSANSNRFELFLNSFDFIYHPSLTIDKSLEDILNQEEKIDSANRGTLIHLALQNLKIKKTTNQNNKNAIRKDYELEKMIISKNECNDNKLDNENIVNEIDEKLKNIDKRIVFFGSNTDPYIKEEQETQCTRKILKLFLISFKQFCPLLLNPNILI